MRIAIACSSDDPASSNMADHIVREYDLDSVSPGLFVYGKREIVLQRIDKPLWSYEHADSLNVDMIIFLSQHQSTAGIPALTVHSMGNWGIENTYGGEPHALSAAAPAPMLSALRLLNSIESSVGKTYEATHHGPCLKTPAFFMEMGGNRSTIENKDLAALVGSRAFETALEILDGKAEYEKTAIGIGGGHYPSKFSALAVGREYAFSYIMPKYAIRRKDGNTDLGMLKKAIEMTKDLDIAVIEWKSLDSATKKEVLSMLDGQGIESEKV